MSKKNALTEQFIINSIINGFDPVTGYSIDPEDERKEAEDEFYHSSECLAFTHKKMIILNLETQKELFIG